MPAAQSYLHASNSSQILYTNFTLQELDDGPRPEFPLPERGPEAVGGVLRVEDGAEGTGAARLRIGLDLHRGVLESLLAQDSAA